jgi:hypothetical protein
VSSLNQNTLTFILVEEDNHFSEEESSSESDSEEKTVIAVPGYTNDINMLGIPAK